MLLDHASGIFNVGDEGDIAADIDALADDFLTLGNGDSGGVISTPEELFRIMQEIIAGDLLPPALAADMKDATYPAGVVLVFNLVDDADPELLALADSMVCSGT